MVGCGSRVDENVQKKKRGRIMMEKKLNCLGVKGLFA